MRGLLRSKVLDNTIGLLPKGAVDESEDSAAQNLEEALQKKRDKMYQKRDGFLMADRGIDT